MGTHQADMVASVLAGQLASIGSFQGAYTAGVSYKANDLVTNNGTIYSRNTAGTPAGAFVASEWTAVGPQGELGFASITANWTAGSSGPVAQDVTGLSVTVTCTGRSIMVEASAAQLGSTGTPTGSPYSVGSIYDVTGAVELARTVVGGPSGNPAGTLAAHARLTPAAGSRTFKVQGWAQTGQNCQILAGATYPAFIRVVEF